MTALRHSITPILSKDEKHRGIANKIKNLLSTPTRSHPAVIESCERKSDEDDGRKQKGNIERANDSRGCAYFAGAIRSVDFLEGDAVVEVPVDDAVVALDAGLQEAGPLEGSFRSCGARMGHALRGGRR